MQTIYNKDNINLNYMNNYVEFFFENNKLHLCNTLYNKELIISGDNKVLNELIKSLNNGIDNNGLIKILSKLTDKPETLYEYLLKNFIIE